MKLLYGFIIDRKDKWVEFILNICDAVSKRPVTVSPNTDRLETSHCFFEAVLCVTCRGWLAPQPVRAAMDCVLNPL